MKCAIIGYGKMGHEIERILVERGHSVNLVIDEHNTEELTAEAVGGVDVCFEFTTPSTAAENVRRVLDAGGRVVCGTTGWLDSLADMQQLATLKGGAIFYASNFSIGVNMMFRLNRRLAELMGNCANYRVSIEEIHHTQKRDAPSGTAITLADEIIERTPRLTKWKCIEPQKGESYDPSAEEVLITSLREGVVPGTHTVTYDSDEDTIELRHTLKSRSALALGVVIAAEFVCGKSGVFTMDDLFKE